MLKQYKHRQYQSAIRHFQVTTTQNLFVHVAPQIDLRGAPLKEKLSEFQRDTERLMEYLKERDARKQIKVV